MSRIRYIKPGFFVDDDLAACQLLARLLFAGLWTIADREGRLEDRPRRIRAEILPNEDVDTDALLQELADHGSLIVRYEVDGKRYIAIPSWSKHQKPHSREPRSTIPEPTEHHLGSAQAPPRQCSDTDEAVPEHDLGDAEPCLARARNFDLDLDLDGDLNGVREELLSGENAPDVLEHCTDLVTSDRFEEFWDVYPRHENKRKAKTGWSRVSRANRDLAIGVATIMGEMIATGQQDRRFVPHPTTFINGERWEDWREGIPAGWCAADSNGKQAAREATLQAAMAMYRKEHPDEPL